MSKTRRCEDCICADTLQDGRRTLLICANTMESPGQMVRVKRGLLRGAEGRLLERRGALRLIVGVDLLGKAVTADIRADDVEPM